MYGLIRSLNKVFKTGMYDYCNIETNDHLNEENNTLITKDGGIMSVIKVDGSYSLIGKRKFKENMISCMDDLSGVLKKTGFKIQFVFNRNPDSSIRDVEKNIIPVIKTASHLNIDLEGMIKQRSEVIGGKTSSESCYIVLTTLPGILNSKTLKTALKDRGDKVKDFNIGIRPGEFSQSPYVAISELREIHSGFVNSFENALKGVVNIKKLSSHDSINCIRKEINLEMTSDNWKPSLLGDKVKMRCTKESNANQDVSHLMNPGIGFQLFNQRPEQHEDDSSLIKMGGKIIAPLMIDIPPQESKPFSDLFDKINDDIPWRWSFTLETGHNEVMSKISTKNGFATFLSLFSSDNKLIKDAAEELLMFAKSGETMMMGYMSLCTWGDNITEVNRRKQILAQSASNWGNLDVIEEFGDPISAWCDTIPGMTKRPISTSFPIPSLEAFSMMPLTRPTSPWDTGSMLFRTVDNKLYPYTAGSSKQAAWFDLIFAPPGFGKSFFLAASNMSLITNPGNTILPRISIIDIGFSSAAFVNLVKSSLPNHQKHFAQAYKIENTKEYSINVFDTPLGCQFPLSVDREFIINMLTLLLTPAGSQPILRLSEIVGKLIDEMYLYFSEEYNPKIYEPLRDEKVDETLTSLNFTYSDDQEVTWIEVVTFLFDKGYTHEAYLAQRYAVPTFSDTTSVLSESTNIRDNFDGALTNNESIIKFIEGMISSVASDYPLITGPSRFDIGSARICSMDISSVAKGGSPQGNKKVGVMYMLATNITTKSFFTHPDILKEIPEHFHKFHIKRIEDDADIAKKICMDEFHRTEHCPEVRTQAVQYVREGRKFNIHVALLSQLIDDFDDAMIELVNNVYILSKGNAEDTIEKIKKKFKPSEDGIRALKKYCKGPGPEGSAMLYLGNVKSGDNIEMVIRLTLGPLELWAYTTTQDDVRLRTRLADEVGLNNTLRILSTEFPGGGAKNYINSKRIEMEVGDDSNVLDIIKNELIMKYRNIIQPT